MPSKRNRRNRSYGPPAVGGNPSGSTIPGGQGNAQPSGGGQHRVITQTISYSGPIPVEYFQGLEQVVPGSAERFIKLTEDQTRHRIAMEELVVRGGELARTRGIFCGFLIAMTLAGGGIWLAANGQPWAGATIAASAAAGLTGVFVYGRKSQAEERLEKSKVMSSSRS